MLHSGKTAFGAGCQTRPDADSKFGGNSVSVMTKLVIVIAFGSASCFAQTGNVGPTRDTANVKLEKMPESLEVRFALSAIPPHLREGATCHSPKLCAFPLHMLLTPNNR